MFRGSVFYEMWMACDDLQERAELWQAIMEYWMFNKEPPQKFKRDFVNVRFILEKSKSLKQKRSDAWKSHTWNQYTKWDTKRQAQNKPVEQMEQLGTNGTNKNKKENKNIKENIKRKFLDFVLLTDEEYNKLIERYGKWTIERKITDLNNYIWSKWKKYKSHYFTILERLRKENIKPLEKKPEPPQENNNNLQIDTRASWLKEAFPLNK